MNILNYSSSDSHTYEEEPYLIDEQTKELFFGYVMQLCHVIKWFGKYAENNPDIEANTKKQMIIKQSKEELKPKEKEKQKKMEIEKVSVSIAPPTIEEIKSKKYLIMRDGATLYCGRCKLDASISYTSGQVVLEEIVNNEGDDKTNYPYIATRISKIS